MTTKDSLEYILYEMAIDAYDDVEAPANAIALVHHVDTF